MRITLRAARINKGLTQEALALALNVSKKTVCEWENGKRLPKLDKIEPICAALGVRYDDVKWIV